MNPPALLVATTVGSDFRSTALRLASPQRPRRDTSWQAFETQQAEFSVDSFAREPARAAPCHFVSPCEEVAHALIGIAVNAAECLSARSVAEVVRPAP